jgi:hypothetical protein
MSNLIASSENYRIHGSFEEAHLIGPGIVGHVVVGDFYGDVACACIDNREKWCVTGGNGIVVYQITKPFESYAYDTVTPQWKELWRSDEDYYLEAIYQVEANIVRLVIDVNSEAKGIYELNVDSLEFRQLM